MDPYHNKRKDKKIYKKNLLLLLLLHSFNAAKFSQLKESTNRSWMRNAKDF